jgi:hypothetical protein
MLDVVSSSVCKARRQPDEYVGRIVRFHVTYESDHMFYSYISDASCSSKSTLIVEHPIRTHGDDSVVAFFKEEDERCKNMKTTVCPVKADLDVDALVLKQPDGMLMVEFKKIRRYVFL